MPTTPAVPPGVHVSGEIRIGRFRQIDPGVFLGYPTGRKVALGPLEIGEGALIRSGTVLYAGSRFGSGLETGHHVVIREENRIGDRLSIWNHSTIDYGCTIGSGVKIHNHVYVAQFTVIEDDVFLAPGVQIANDRFPQSHHLEGPTIRKGAVLGVNVTVLPGVEIGAGALVGAGAVVARNLPARAIAVGNPARVLRIKP